MIYEIDEDLIAAPQIVLAQQVDCSGVMTGPAAAIARKWPIVYDKYTKILEKQDRWDRPLLRVIGTVQYIDLGGHIIVNMFSRASHSGDRLRRSTNYEAFVSCCGRVKDRLDRIGVTEIAFPKYIGCGEDGGGSWKIIKGIIESELENIDIFFYRGKENYGK